MDITGLPAGELQKLRQSLSEDVQLITNNFGNLKVAQARYTQALEAVTQLSEASEDKTIMVPLTGSLYIPGKLNNVKSVMVDIGQTATLLALTTWAQYTANAEGRLGSDADEGQLCGVVLCFDRYWLLCGEADSRR